MKKSGVIHTNKQFESWMRDNKFWTNPSFCPNAYDLPSASDYPLIIVADLNYDVARGRDYINKICVSLQDFYEQPLEEKMPNCG